MDTIARMGGDEFTIILDGITHVDQVAMVVQRVLDALALPVSIEDREIYVSASIGITLYPFDTDDIDTLHKNANIAMYHAKQEGRNNYQFYSSEMSVGTDELVSMESYLRRALERDEFTLHYQPQVDVRTGKIIGAEALLRWHNAEMGMIPPLKFIPLAEKTGLIIPIGDWVLRIACAQNKAWQEAGYMPMVMAVNLSQRQFRHNDLLATIANVLDGSTTLEARYLELEITESMVMHHAELAAKLGVAVADIPAVEEPMGMIKPVFSARGMNLSGGIIPISALCQRSSASAPMIFPVLTSTCGW